MNNIDLPYLKNTVEDNILTMNNCTDVCKHAIACPFCTKFIRTQETNNNNNNNNIYYWIIIGFLIILVLFFLFKNKN